MISLLLDGDQIKVNSIQKAMEHQTEKIVGAQKRKNFNKKILRRITNQIEKLQISEEVKRKNQNAVGKAEVPENKNGLLRSITPSDTDR